jgi:hypothetical protein
MWDYILDWEEHFQNHIWRFRVKGKLTQNISRECPFKVGSPASWNVGDRQDYICFDQYCINIINNTHL